MKTMNEIRMIHPGDKGSVLLYTLMILTVLSLIGATGIQTTWFEITLSGNDKFINRLKIKAESTAATAVAIVEDQNPKVFDDNDWTSTTRPRWYSRGIDGQFEMESGNEKRKSLIEYTRNTANWTEDNCMTLTPETDDVSDEEANETFLKEFSRCRFQVIDAEVSQGYSYQIGNRYPTMQNFYITGMCEENQGKCLVQIGYRKRI